MRQFFLLLAEWYAQMRLEDARWYRLICCWMKDAPRFGEVFPVWGGEEDTEEHIDEDDDEVAFRQVTAALTPYRN